MSLPRYADYKDSGVEWLGQIPKHWDTLQSRRMFAVRSEPALPTDRMLTASQKHGVLFQTDFMELEGRRVVEVIMGTESLKHVEPNDFIISMRSFQGGIEWCKLRGSTSFHYVMLRPVKHVWPPYFAHLFKSSIYIQALRRTTDLIRDGQELRFSNFAQVDLPVVPLEEQKAIAIFLDREIAKIDALIAEQEKLIALLVEKRQATISHAVTKGLDPNIAMKDSGVEWLGIVPAHWRIDRIKRSIDSSKNGIWGNEPQSDASDIFCVRVADFDRVRLVVKPAIPTIRSVSEKERVGRLLQPGNLLLEKSGGGDSQPVGQVVLFDQNEPAVCSNFVARIVLRDGMAPGYWKYAHVAAYALGVNVGAINQTSGIQNLDQDRYFNERAAFPPFAEQKAIAEFLDIETAKIYALTEQAERNIRLLKERRSALVATAVTGQLDVRCVAQHSLRLEEFHE
nr:restriction endonuclease subunit S [uncultured Rhodoferax sp.]